MTLATIVALLVLIVALLLAIGFVPMQRGDGGPAHRRTGRGGAGGSVVMTTALCGDPTCESPSCTQEAIDNWNRQQEENARVIVRGALGLPTDNREPT